MANKSSGTCVTDDEAYNSMIHTTYTASCHHMCNAFSVRTAIKTVRKKKKERKKNTAPRIADVRQREKKKYKHILCDWVIHDNNCINNNNANCKRSIFLLYLLALPFISFFLRALKIQLFKCWLSAATRSVAKQQILEAHLMITHRHTHIGVRARTPLLVPLTRVKWLCKYPCFMAKRKWLIRVCTCNKIRIECVFGACVCVCMVWPHRHIWIQLVAIFQIVQLSLW